MFHTTASETVNSFADLLSTAASDIIDWAPPGKVAKWNQQLQTASRRSKDDVQEERLRREAGGIGSAGGVATADSESTTCSYSDGGPAADVATGVATSLSSRSTNSGGRVVTAATLGQPGGLPDTTYSSPFSGSYGAAAQWGSLLYRGLVNGLVGLQSQSTATVYQTPRFSWNVGCVSSVNMSGFPFGFDAAWRATHLFSLLPTRHRHETAAASAAAPQPLPPLATLLTHTQWQTPVQNFWPSSFVALLRSARFDASLRVDNRLILCNLCVNGRPAVLRTSTSSASSAASSSPNSNLATGGVGEEASSAAYQSRWTQWWCWAQAYRGWIRQVRGGLGLAIRGDFASGVNLFTGLTVVTEGNLHAAYHIDVLRRLTCSVAGPLWTAPPATTSSSHHQHTGGATTAAAVGAVRLMLNTITFEHSTLEAGASIPIAASITALVPNMVERISWWSRVPHDVLLHVSTSTAGVMLGLQVQHAERYLAPYLSEAWYRRLLSGARVDVTGGLAIRSMVSAPSSSSGVVNSNSSTSVSSSYRSPTSSGRQGSDGVAGPTSVDQLGRQSSGTGGSSGAVQLRVDAAAGANASSLTSAVNGVQVRAGAAAAASTPKPRRSLHSASFLLLTFQ